MLIVMSVSADSYNYDSYKQQLWMWKVIIDTIVDGDGNDYGYECFESSEFICEIHLNYIFVWWCFFDGKYVFYIIFWFCVECVCV